MKILLVNPDTPMQRYLTHVELFPNGAILLLGTMLKKDGHEVRLVHMKADKVLPDGLIGIIKDFRPHMVGITCITFQSPTLKEISRKIKSVYPSLPLIAGGPQISALESINFDLKKEYPCIDTFVIGEGDFALQRIIKADKLDDLPLVLKEPRLDNINHIPPIDLSLVNFPKAFTGTYPPGPRPEMFIMGSRGCPFNCTFCSRAVVGKVVRYRNPTSIVDDAERLVTDWKVKEIFFHDDTFNLNRKWCEAILDEILNRKLNKKVAFRTPCRVNNDLLDLDLLKKMKAAGFWLIFYGVESGSQYMLEKMGKGTRVSEIERAFRLTHEAGIKAEASFIVGLPQETRTTIKESVALWRRIKPEWSSFSRAIPFPGTNLYEEVKAKKLLLVDSWDEFELDKVLCKTESLGEKELEYLSKELGYIMTKAKIKELLKHPIRLIEFARDVGKDKETIKMAFSKLLKVTISRSKF